MKINNDIRYILMAKIEEFRIKNFRVLKDVTLGRLWNHQEAKPLTPLTAVIGKNGTGKSTIFDAFGFLADALKLGIEEACYSRVLCGKLRSGVCVQDRRGYGYRHGRRFALLVRTAQSGVRGRYRQRG